MKKTEDEFIRKRKMRQKKLRKRRRIRMVIVFSVLAIAVFCVLSVTVLFPIRSITVTGSERYNAETVIAASGLKIGDNILMASSKRCKEQLRKVLPYIENVNLKRNLAGELALRVTEAKENQVYLFEGKYYPVSRENHILRESDELPNGLLIIAANIKKPIPGEDISFTDQRTDKALSEILSCVQKSGLKVDQIDLLQESNITLKTEGRFFVKLGGRNYLEEKIRHLITMVKKIGSDKSGTIDVSMWTPDNAEAIWKEMTIE